MSCALISRSKSIECVEKNTARLTSLAVSFRNRTKLLKADECKANSISSKNTMYGLSLFLFFILLFLNISREDNMLNNRFSPVDILG